MAKGCCPGLMVKGEFQNNTFNGTGTYHWPNGTLDRGVWVDGKLKSCESPLVCRSFSPEKPVTYFRSLEMIGITKKK